MKKVLLIILILAAGWTAYAFTIKKTLAPQIDPDSMLEKEHEQMPNPSPSPEPTPAPEPSPTPNPNPRPVKDDIDDVDIAPAKLFNITGKNFSFSQTEIRVKKGDRVVINFESTEGFHDWVVDEFNAHTDRVNPGTKTSVEFIAGQTGTFEYYCSVSIHRAAGMKGQLIVE